jgi:hypothetical protein
MNPYARQSAAVSREWAAEQEPVCMVCGERFAQWPPASVHHIERRAHAPGRYAHRCNLLAACDACHDGALATMGHAKQLAYKLAHDPANYDLAAWLRLRDPELRAPNRVTQDEVDRYAEMVRGAELVDSPW